MKCFEISNELNETEFPIFAILKRFEGELTCSICLDIYTKPVLIKSGQIYCKNCINDVFKKSITCPNTNVKLDSNEKNRIFRMDKIVIGYLNSLKQAKCVAAMIFNLKRRIERFKSRIRNLKNNFKKILKNNFNVYHEIDDIKGYINNLESEHLDFKDYLTPVKREIKNNEPDFFTNGTARDNEMEFPIFEIINQIRKELTCKICNYIYENPVSMGSAQMYCERCVDDTFKNQWGVSMLMWNLIRKNEFHA